MRTRKLEAFAATGADTVCADNPGCLMHLNEGRASTEPGERCTWRKC